MATQHIDFATLNEYLDQMLTPTALDQAEAHLAGCAYCRRQLVELQALFSTLDELPEAQLDRDLSAAVVAAIGARPASIEQAAPSRRFPWPLLLLQAATAGALSILIWPAANRWMSTVDLSIPMQLVRAQWAHWLANHLASWATLTEAGRGWGEMGRGFTLADASGALLWWNGGPLGWGVLLATAALLWLLGNYTWLWHR